MCVGQGSTSGHGPPHLFYFIGNLCFTEENIRLERCVESIGFGVKVERKVFIAVAGKLSKKILSFGCGLCMWSKKAQNIS
jgi:hypothetical protein